VIFHFGKGVTSGATASSEGMLVVMMMMMMVGLLFLV
jgi:hypothetical protein